jgi:hypothetical protein
VIVSPLRIFQSATFLFALMSAEASFSQGLSGNAAPPFEVSLATTLPDAPSYSSSQQGAQPAQAPSQTGATPPQGQTGAQPPPNETPEQKKERERREGEAQVKKQEHQRNLGVIPSFNTVLGGTVPPLTVRQKFDLVFHSSIDPYTFALAAIVAGIGELSPPAQGYGWGPVGYFYRYGTAYGDNIDGALWGNAILPSLWHQDPRYYRKGEGKATRRIIHAALSTIICRGDNGKTQFNYSNVVGNFIAGGLSNLYYPHEQRGASLIWSNGLTVTAEGAVGAQLLEFGPDLGAMLSRHHQRALAKKAAAKAAQGQSTPPTNE